MTYPVQQKSPVFCECGFVAASQSAACPPNQRHDVQNKGKAMSGFLRRGSLEGPGHRGVDPEPPLNIAPTATAGSRLSHKAAVHCGGNAVQAPSRCADGDAPTVGCTAGPSQTPCNSGHGASMAWDLILLQICSVAGFWLLNCLSVVSVNAVVLIRQWLRRPATYLGLSLALAAGGLHAQAPSLTPGFGHSAMSNPENFDSRALGSTFGQSGTYTVNNQYSHSPGQSVRGFGPNPPSNGAGSVEQVTFTGQGGQTYTVSGWVYCPGDDGTVFRNTQCGLQGQEAATTMGFGTGHLGSSGTGGAVPATGGSVSSGGGYLTLRGGMQVSISAGVGSGTRQVITSCNPVVAVWMQCWATITLPPSPASVPMTAFWTVSGQHPGTLPFNTFYEDDFGITAGPITAPLSLTKTNPTSMTVGVPTTYQVALKNTGTTPNGSAFYAFTDRLPPNVQYNSISIQGGSSVGVAVCNPDANPGTVSGTGLLLDCFIQPATGTTLAAGATITALLNVTPLAGAAGQSVTNRARVDLTGASDFSTINPDACTGTGTPTAGCAKSAAITVVGGTPQLGLEKTNPGSLTVGVPANYTLKLSNTGSGASGTTLNVYEQLPPKVQFNSGAGAPGGTVTPSGGTGGTGVNCTVDSGTVASGQLLKCTVTLPSGLAASTGTANFTLNVTPLPGVASSVSNKAQIDPTGANAAQTPTSCTATGTPAGCAVTGSLPVGNGVNLGLEKTNPGSLTVGVAANYTLKLINNGTGPTTTYVDVYEQLPLGIVLNNPAAPAGGTVPATGVTCTEATPASATAGALLKCKVDLPDSGLPAGGNTQFTVNVMPTAAASGSSVINKAAVDSDGGNDPQTPSTCTGANAPTPGCTTSPPQTVTGHTLSGMVLQDNGAGGGVAHDGAKSGSEGGRPGVTVTLGNCSGTTYATALTDGDGRFQFSLAAVPPGPVCLTETPLAAWVPVSFQPGTTGGSYNAATRTLTFNLASNTSYSGILFGEVPNSLLVGDGRQQVQAGQSAVYGHSFVAGASGSVVFSTSDQPSQAGAVWGSVIYLDSQCNAGLDGADTVLTGPVTVTAGQVVCLLVKVNSPSSALSGSSDQTTLSATETLQPTPQLGSVVKVQTRSDITTVGAQTSGSLVLLKEVRKVGSCPSTSADTLPFAASNSAMPGSFLEYRLNYTNQAPGPVTGIQISDSVPAYTGFQSAGCDALPSGLASCTLTQQPAVGSTGALVWQLGDSTMAPVGLQSGGHGSVVFCVRLSP